MLCKLACELGSVLDEVICHACEDLLDLGVQVVLARDPLSQSLYVNLVNELGSSPGRHHLLEVSHLRLHVVGRVVVGARQLAAVGHLPVLRRVLGVVDSELLPEGLMLPVLSRGRVVLLAHHMLHFIYWLTQDINRPLFSYLSPTATPQMLRTS